MEGVSGKDGRRKVRGSATDLESTSCILSDVYVGKAHGLRLRISYLRWCITEISRGRAAVTLRPWHVIALRLSLLKAFHGCLAKHAGAIYARIRTSCQRVPSRSCPLLCIPLSALYS